MHGTNRTHLYARRVEGETFCTYSVVEAFLIYLLLTFVYLCIVVSV